MWFASRRCLSASLRLAARHGCTRDLMNIQPDSATQNPLDSGLLPIVCTGPFQNPVGQIQITFFVSFFLNHDTVVLRVLPTVFVRAHSRWDNSQRSQHKTPVQFRSNLKLYYSLQITCAREALNAVHRKIRMKIVVIFSYLFLSFRREMYRLARSFTPEPN